MVSVRRSSSWAGNVLEHWTECRVTGGFVGFVGQGAGGANGRDFGRDGQQYGLESDSEGFYILQAGSEEVGSDQMDQI